MRATVRKSFTPGLWLWWCPSAHCAVAFTPGVELTQPEALAAALAHLAAHHPKEDQT